MGTREQPATRLECNSIGGDDNLELDAISDAVFVFDRAAAVIGVNALAQLLVGYTESELVGQTIDSVIPRLKAPLAAATDYEHVRCLPASIGTLARHRSGALIPVEVLICPHGNGAALAIVRPTSATECGFRDDDVAQIVHDLKSPLATIAIESELLDHSIEQLDQEAMCAAVHRIQRNVGFLDRMIQDLLDLCAIDAGKFVLHRSPTDLRSLIKDVLDRVVATRDRHRVLFEGAEHLTLDVDELRLERVVANLIQNALKYTPRPAGAIVRLSRTADHVCVSVLDAGPGVPDADCMTIFDKFRRVGDTARIEGNGLGLYVSKRIVEAHGGRIGVERMRGGGSRFFFELPLG